MGAYNFGDLDFTMRSLATKFIKLSAKWLLQVATTKTGGFAMMSAQALTLDSGVVEVAEAGFASKHGRSAGRQQAG
jgi:hypothetical protein